MKKFGKVALVLLLCASVFSFSGCASFLNILGQSVEGNYESSTSYVINELSETTPLTIYIQFMSEDKTVSIRASDRDNNTYNLGKGTYEGSFTDADYTPGFTITVTEVIAKRGNNLVATSPVKVTGRAVSTNTFNCNLNELLKAANLSGNLSNVRFVNSFDKSIRDSNTK